MMKEQQDMVAEWGDDTQGLAEAVMEKEAKKSMTAQVESYASSAYVANSIILGVQTVAFVGMLVGLILHCVTGRGKCVTDKP